jgi:hypothetical protein
MCERFVVGIRMKHDVYAVPPYLRHLYIRQAKIQVRFFEALYAVSGQEQRGRVISQRGET